MKKTLLAATIAASMIAPAAHADFVGLYVGGGSWQQEFSGTMTDIQSGDEVNFGSTLGLDDNNGLTFYAALEHPVPFLPNFRLESVDLQDRVTTTLDSDFSFGGEDFQSGDELTTDLDLSHLEYTMYYELLDNWVNLDVGISVKHFNNAIEMTASRGTETLRGEVDLSAYIPMLYAWGQFDLPFTGLSLGMGGSMVEYSGSSLRDLKAQIAYETDLGFGIEAGYRTLGLELDDVDDLSTDAKFKGAYINVMFHF